MFVILLGTTKRFDNNKGVGYRKRRIGVVDIIYIPRTRKTGVGVRNDSFTHMILPEKVNELKYSRPCVCGSLTHCSTRSLDCLFNKRYMDVEVILS